MIPPEKLRFRARGTAMVQNYDRLAAGINAFVGRAFGPAKDRPGRHGFAATGAAEELAYHPHGPEYVRACAQGDLWAADEETAKHVDHYAKGHGLPPVTFDPSFGGATAAAAPPPAGELATATTTTPSNAPAGKPEKG